MISNSMITCLRVALAAAMALVATSATAADRIRLAVQRTGTLAWELDIIKAHGLDKKADLQIEALELASPEAGKVAVRGGSADMFLSDWLYVSRERSLGDGMVFYPSSSTLGGVMVPANSPIKDVADLKGRKLAVAGGPIDKSWLLLQALAKRGNVDLRRQATIVYGAPPLLTQKALQGENDATLTYWNFCADLESKGHKEVIPTGEVMKKLGARAPVAILGYSFDGAWAAKNKSAVDRFIDAARQAKDILASSEAEWQRLAPRIGVSDPKALALYRQRYRAGIVTRSVAEEEADARALYLVLAEVGGTELVGPARELDRGTFYRPGAGL
jgi:NitT/TauT family transport system substrate-binding protein